MKYAPTFDQGEFRFPTPHYQLKVANKKILYAHIRKNASSQFRSIINRRTHPKYFLKPRNIIKYLIGLSPADRNHIGGNMRYFKHPYGEPVEGFEYDAIIFVYRDPLERLFSVFKNKFIDNINSDDIKYNFENLTCCRFERATFAHFVKYTSENPLLLDPHVIPQKAHLWEIDYRPIKLDNLRGVMDEIIGSKDGEQLFGYKSNSSGQNGNLTEDKFEPGSLCDTPVCDLRKIRKEVEYLPIKSFIGNEICSVVKTNYAQDYEMISRIEV